MGFRIPVYLAFEVQIHKADSYGNSWNILSLVNSNFERVSLIFNRFTHGAVSFAGDFTI